MTAPARPPSFFDALTGRDTPYPDSLREPRFLIDDLARDARDWPNWVLDDDDNQRVVTLGVTEHVPERKVVIAFTVGSLHGAITAVPDPSGYLRIVVDANGAGFLTAYVERIWEEYEIWPPGATAAMGEESPGRMGKRRSWVSISARGWPALAAVANSQGWLNLKQVER